jgi:hypothetical protein
MRATRWQSPSDDNGRHVPGRMADGIDAWKAGLAEIARANERLENARRAARGRLGGLLRLERGHAFIGRVAKAVHRICDSTFASVDAALARIERVVIIVDETLDAWIPRRPVTPATAGHSADPQAPTSSPAQSAPSPAKSRRGRAAKSRVRCIVYERARGLDSDARIDPVAPRPSRESPVRPQVAPPLSPVDDSAREADMPEASWPDSVRPTVSSQPGYGEPMKDDRDPSTATRSTSDIGIKNGSLSEGSSPIPIRDDRIAADAVRNAPKIVVAPPSLNLADTSSLALVCVLASRCLFSLAALCHVIFFICRSALSAVFPGIESRRSKHLRREKRDTSRRTRRRRPRLERPRMPTPRKRAGRVRQRPRKARRA